VIVISVSTTATPGVAVDVISVRTTPVPDWLLPMVSV
jgi:hypothetical protein